MSNIGASMLFDEIAKSFDKLEQEAYCCEVRIRELSQELETQYTLLHHINVCLSRLIADYSLDRGATADEP